MLTYLPHFLHLPPRPLPPSFPSFFPFLSFFFFVCLFSFRFVSSQARQFRFFDFNSFDCEEYEYFEQVENGDLNWHISDGCEGPRLLCFAGPHNTREVSREGYRTLTPDDYIPYFKKKNVQLVIRLNKKYYDERKFTNAGIRHQEHYYLDGSVPPMRILKKVIEAMESVGKDGAVAVHCKAGLGRAGTCSACWIMKHYRLSAAEVIGWMRICRPGTVIGPQQHFLEDIQEQIWHEGDVMRSKVNRSLGELGDEGGDGGGDGGGEEAETSAKRVSAERERKGLDNMTNGMGSMGVSSEATVGRPGQSEELRARRAVMSGRK